ncbi:MAG: hypothetical protein J7K53_03825 [Bacteroidales bacterium]|nr:hypothetical protein [Bacteroidales bacterium]
MKEKVDLLFLIPFYDKDIEQLQDTIDSITYYIAESVSIIALNDCKDGAEIGLAEQWAGKINVIEFFAEDTAKWPANTYGSLFCKKYQALEYAVKKYGFKYLIFMDTDALVTGSELFRYLEAYCSQHSHNVGILGSYNVRADGKKRTRWQWACYILYLRYFNQKIKKKSLLWNSWLPNAKKNGYRLGSHMLGGAFVMTYECSKSIIKIYPYNIISQEELQLLEIGDDVLFSWLTYACNYSINDFGGPDDPLALAIRCLPIEKEKIISTKKQLIHSLKLGKHGESEKELRAFFRDQRK